MSVNNFSSSLVMGKKITHNFFTEIVAIMAIYSYDPTAPMPTSMLAELESQHFF